MPHLVVHDPTRGIIVFDLTNTMIAGRESTNSLPLCHQPISRQHAVFENDKHGWLVRDLGSANGTFVNGVRIDKQYLNDGDVVRIGPVKLVFHKRDAIAILHAEPMKDGDTLDAGSPDERLELVCEVARSVGTADDSEEVLGRMLASTLRLLRAERGSVGLTDASGREIVRQIVQTRDRAQTDDIVMSRSVLDAVLMQQQAVIIRDARGADMPETLEKQGVRSAMCVPIEASGHTFGYLYVDDRGHENRFVGKDLHFIQALSRLLGALLDNAERAARAKAIAEASAGYGPLEEIVGRSEAIEKLRIQIRKCATSTAHVLIHGESGTGKELVARVLHRASARANQPFIAVNCASIPETLIESVLFGYAKGAFSGALRARRGQFVLADGGILLLDEVGDLSLEAQAKILRVVEQGEVLPLGAERSVRVNVRVLAASHKNLRHEVEQGRFREDLYYRLSVLRIDVPTLRMHAEDIDILAKVFLESAALNMGKRIQGFSAQALEALRAYSWPGNVRQLKNEIDRAVVVADGPIIDVRDLDDALPSIDDHVSAPTSPKSKSSIAERFATLEPTEKALVEEALTQARGNLSEAARLLGITRIRMRRRVEKYGLRYKDP